MQTPLLYRWRFAALAVAFVLAVLCAVFGPGTVERLDAGGFEVTNGRVAQAAALARREFGAQPPDVVAIIDMEGHSPRNPAFRAVLRELEQRLAALPSIGTVQSPASMPDDRLISRDGTSALVTVSLVGSADDKQRAYPKVAAAFEDPRIHAAIGGPVAVAVAGQAQAEHDLVRTELVALPVVAVLLVFIFRGLVAAFLPLAVGGLSIGLALVSLRLLANVTPVAVFALNIVTFLGLGLAIDYSLFIVHRFREELAAGRPVPLAVQRTVASAGKTVAYSGLAVAVSLLALLWFPIVLLRSIALGGAIVVVMTVAVATIVLPAALSVLGERIDALSWQRHGEAEGRGGWHALALAVMRRPGLLALAITSGFIALGTPFLRLQTAISDARIFPPHSEVRLVHDRLSAREGFAHLGRSGLTIVLESDGPMLERQRFDALTKYEAWLADRDYVVDVTGPATLLERMAPAGTDEQNMAMLEQLAPRLDAVIKDSRALVEVAIATPPGALETNALVRDIRAHAPPLERTPGVGTFRVELAGQAAVAEEVHAEIGAHLHAVAITIATVTFVVLVLAFGAIPVAIKAVLMNVLSLTTSFGAMVFIFQDGRLERLLDYQSTGAIDPLVLVLMFAIVFGLSMDYELFLLSRVREEWDRTGDAHGSVARGLENTAGLITSAALLLVVVTVGFATSKLLFLRELGIGMALAIVIDAGVIRPFLVPATMALMRRYNWWAPAWFVRAWKRSRIGIHEGDAREE